MPDDKPFRIVFPPAIVLHGSDPKQILERALEYLRLPGKIHIEPSGEAGRAK